MTSTVVIGGGISGLLCAWRLALRGDTVTLLEADRLGGSVRRADVGGFVGDVGAESFAITRPEASALVAELGLASVAPARSDARLVLADVVAPLPADSLLGIPGRPGADDVRVLLGPADVDRALADDGLPVGDLPTSLGGLVRARMGDAVVRRLVDPVVSGVHAVSADSVDADTVAPGLRAAVMQEGSLAAAVRALRGRAGAAGAPVRSLPGGMAGLVDALAAAVRGAGVNVAQGARVAAVRRAAGGGWLVAADGGEHRADRVILALPVSTAAEVLGSGLPEIAALLREVPLGDVVVLALHLDAPALDDAPIGSGALVARGVPGIAAKGLTHASAKWAWIRAALPAGHHLVRLSYGRDGEDPWAVIGADPQARGLADVRAITGVADLTVVGHHVQPWPRSLSHPRPGQAQWRQRVRAALPEGLAVVGPGISGNGIAGAIADVDALLD